METKTPNKFNYLDIAAHHDIPIPPKIFISNREISKGTFHKRLGVFLEKYPASKYIVRSCTSIEDEAEKSFAGFFESSKSVSSAELEKTVLTYHQINKKIMSDNNITGEAHLFVMPFIESVKGGVMFYPWLHFSEHALIEFGESPERVVSGKPEGKILISRCDSLEDIQVNGELHTTIRSQLSDLITKLSSIFDFHFDVEWIFDGAQTHVLQIRPITIAPTALKFSILKENETINFGPISDGLNKLSPLSFSLFSYLYSNANEWWETFEICGGESFLSRHKSGRILTNTAKSTSYFSNKNWLSPFTRRLRAPMIIRELQNEMLEQKLSLDHDLDQITRLFCKWQIAQSMLLIMHKKIETEAYPGEYELFSTYTHQYLNDSLVTRWKESFLLSLEPLRKMVAQNPHLTFCEDIESLKLPKSYARIYMEALADSINDPTPMHTSNEVVYLVKKDINGIAYRIDAPLAWSGPLPKNKIIVSPFIPLSWIHELPNIKGLITTTLGLLSHQAITLREHFVPSIIIPNNEFRKIKDGKHISY